MNPYLGHFDWDILYMTCFGVGFVLSVVGFISGFIHWHIGDFRFGHLHSLKASAGGRGGPIAPVNGFTIVAFLCWFGGTGYLLAHGRMAGALVLSLSLLSGLVGAGLVFWFFAKVMLPRERSLEPSDTPIIGVLGRVSSPVPAGGVGEMLYSQGGARRSIPIAAEDGVAIGRNAEVVVLRYARGIAYVRRWDEMQQILLGDAPASLTTDLGKEPGSGSGGGLGGGLGTEPRGSDRP